MSDADVPHYKPGDVANGHVLTSEGTWVPLGGQAPEPSYKPGDVANGHVLTSNGTWIPATQGKPDASRRSIVIGFVVVLVVLLLGAALVTAMENGNEAATDWEKRIECIEKNGAGSPRC